MKIKKIIKSQKYRIIFVAILLVSALLRAYLIDKNSLWFDEGVAATMILSEGSGAVGEAVLLDQQALLYYPVIASWVSCFGFSIVSLRAFSAIMNIFSVLMLFFLGKAFFSDKEALLAAFILALAPIHIWYSQEVRGYTLGVLFVLVSIWLLVRALQTDRVFYWVSFVFFCMFTVCVDHGSIFFIFSASAFLFYKNWRARWKKLFLAYFIFTLAFLPQLFLIVLPQKKIAQLSSWRLRPGLEHLLCPLYEFELGYGNPHIMYYLFTALTVSVFFFAYARLRKDKDKSTLCKILAFMTFFPLGMAFVISQVLPIYFSRYFLSASVLFYLLLAVLICALKKKQRVIAIFLVASFLSIGCFNYYRGYFKKPAAKNQGYHLHHGVHAKDNDFELVMNFFNDNAKKGDILALSHPKLTPVISFYTRHFKTNRLLKFPYLGKNKKEVVSQNVPCVFIAEKNYLGKDEFLSAFINRLYELDKIYNLDKSTALTSNIFLIDDNDAAALRTLGYERIWLLSSSWAQEENFDECSIAVKDWFDLNMKALEERKEGKIGITLYENY